RRGHRLLQRPAARQRRQVLPVAPGSSLPADAFAGVEYTVFGCGNRDWAATYQAIPTLIDAQLEKHGAKRMYRRGEGDGRGDFDRGYSAWHAGLFPSLAAALHLPERVVEAQAPGRRFSLSFIN